MKSTRVAIFASGSGTNAKKIIEYFQDRSDINISLIVTNRSSAGVLKIAEESEISSKIIVRRDFSNEDVVLDLMDEYQIDFIVLAGFLLLIPNALVRRYPYKMLNIHPALLPKYGGKGMYGMHVHQAVKDANESETGITIHYVNEKYDEGAIVFQAKTSIDPEDSPIDIAKKVQILEHKHFPKIVDTCIKLSRMHEEEE
jgi:phosphoribosylglycinamide formyltransferase-1